MTTLNELLTKSLQWCVAHREQERIITLGKGLVLMLMVDSSGANHLLAGRLPPSVPSEGEIQTVLRAWPQQPVPILPWEMTDDQREGSLFPLLDVHRGPKTMKHMKYNSLSFQWRPVTPQPFAGVDRE